MHCTCPDLLPSNNSCLTNHSLPAHLPQVSSGRCFASLHRTGAGCESGPLPRDRLAGIMQCVGEHPEELSKVKSLQRQVREVQTIMENNIQIVRLPRALSRMAIFCITLFLYLHAGDLQVSAPMLCEVLPALQRCGCRYAGRKHTDTPPWLLGCGRPGLLLQKTSTRADVKGAVQALARTERMVDLRDCTADINTSADEFRRKTVALHRKIY